MFIVVYNSNNKVFVIQLLPGVID